MNSLSKINCLKKSSKDISVLQKKLQLNTLQNPTNHNTDIIIQNT